MLPRSKLLFAPSWTSAPVARAASSVSGDPRAQVAAACAGHIAAKVDGAGQENAGEPADSSVSIQIILEPRMIEKNSVRSLVR